MYFFNRNHCHRPRPPVWGGCNEGCAMPMPMPMPIERDVPVERREFDCGGTTRTVKHQHIVRHNHDIINEYDVIHEHDFNVYDVVREREVTRRNDHTTHRPNYCGDRGCECNE